MNQQFVIKDLAKETEKQTSKFDFQDFALIFGFVSVEVGVALIYIPAAVILCGVLMFSAFYLIERQKAGKQ